MMFRKSGAASAQWARWGAPLPGRVISRSVVNLARRFALIGACSLLVAALGIQTASSTEYPNRPVRIILGFAAGGPTDILSRILADQLNKKLGAPFVVENRVGAGGNIAATGVARAPADGYTLLVGGTNFVIGPSWFKNLQFDFMKDFQIITTISQNPNVLVVPPDSEMKTVQDVLRKVRAEPGRYTFASSGAGTVVHLAAELFKTQQKLDVRHVPYNGATPAEIDLMAGRVDMMFDSLATALPFIREGKLRALGVTSKQRSGFAPEIPTLAEQGLEEFDVASWYAVWAPTGLPQDIADKLNRAIREALDTPEVRARLAALQAEAFGNSADASDAFQKKELAKWTATVEALGPRQD
jgi:tripartite-type tricarboxylate transporter receptor subunit TctC